MTSVAQLLQRTGDGLIAIDQRQRVVFWNRAATSLLGPEEKDVLGRPCYEVLDCSDDEGEVICGRNCRIFTSMRRGEVLESRELVVRRDDGTQVRYGISFIALDEGPDPARAMFLLRPSPAEEQAETASQRVQRPAGAELVVRCFGSFEVLVGGSRLSGPPLSQNKAGRALRLLVHRRGRKVPRDELAEAIWPDAEPDAARASLKVAIHSIRRALEPELSPRQASRFIGYESDSYTFTSSAATWVDVDAFSTYVSEGRSADKRGATEEVQVSYTEAVKLYRGNYLAEDVYEDWCAGERRRLRETYLSLVTDLASIYAGRSDYARAVDYCWRAVADDGCRESAYRLLMDCLWRDGRPHEALEVYQRCSIVMKRELDVPPMSETTDLFRRIKAAVS